MTRAKPPAHGGKRRGAGRKPTTGTGRAIRLSTELLGRLSALAAGITPQEQLGNLCVQAGALRVVVAHAQEHADPIDSLRQMIAAVDKLRRMRDRSATNPTPPGARR